MKETLKFFLPYFKKKKLLSLAYVALCLESIMTVGVLFLQRNIIDLVFTKKEYRWFPMLLAFYGVFFFGPRLFFTIRKVAFFHIKFDLQENISRAFLEKIYKLSEQLREQKNVGQLFHYLKEDIPQACEIFTVSLLSDACKSALTLLLLAIVIILLDPLVFFLVCAVCMIYYSFLRIFEGNLKQIVAVEKEKRTNISKLVVENIASMKEVIANNRQERQMKAYQNAFEEYFKKVKKQYTKENKITLCTAPFLYATQLFTLVFGGYGILKHSISIGSFVVLFSFVNQFVAELGSLMDQFFLSKNMIVNISRVQSVFQLQEQEVGTQSFPTAVKSIAFWDVSYAYIKDQKMALNRISIDFPVGKKIAIVGKSGCGKSSVIQLLLRLNSPDQGEIFINQRPISYYDSSYCRHVAVVFQQPYFMPDTVLTNLTFGFEYAKDKIEDMCKKMLCYDFITEKKEGFQSFVGENGSLLSGGQKQRIALARALLQEPDILILDEATSALDIKTEDLVQKNIDLLRRGKTTIVIAHRLSTIVNADCIFVMEDGKIVAQGIHEILLKDNHIYQELYQMKKDNNNA